MAHETPTINAEKRDRLGTRYARRLRQAGRLPAVIYGHMEETVHISVDAKETLNHLRHGAHLMNVVVEGDNAETCLVKDLQFGYLGDNVVHVDFARVNLTEEVTVNVALEFTGESPAAKKPGAVVTQNLSELEVVCRAMDIPSEIVVDISGLVDALTIADLKLPQGIRTDLDPTTPVISISFIEEEAEGEAVEVTAEDEPEVIGEAKDEESKEEDES